jgi:perosamine synthetase
MGRPSPVPPAASSKESEVAWPRYSANVNSAILACLQHGDLGNVDMHPAVSELEQEFARVLVPGFHATFFNSGTSALCAGLFAMKLPAGSEVIVPRRTFRATVTPLFQFGLIPRFAECGPDGCASVEGIRAELTKQTRAILITHQWGQPVDLDGCLAIAAEYGLDLIEDCSHAHGGAYDHKPLGTFGKFSFFSCGTTKLVSGGTGGMLLTRQRAIYERALVYGQPKHSCLERIESKGVRDLATSGVGVNLRGNPFAAVLALDHLKNIEVHIRTKNANLAIADDLVAKFLPCLKPVPRPARWTNGTWYKRPFLLSEVDSRTFCDIATGQGLPFGMQDPWLDEALAHAASEFGCPIRPPIATFSTEPIVVLNTLDMYTESWKVELFEARLSAIKAGVSAYA